MSISVSAFYPDANLKESAFSRALTAVAIYLAQPQNKQVQRLAPTVELNFMLTGKFDSPGFTGMRIRTFDSKQARLLIETAVPVSMNQSSNAQKYITAALLDAIENAAEFLRQIEIEFDQPSHMNAIEDFSSL